MERERRPYNCNTSNVTIIFGDITESKMDVIASSDDTQITMSAGDIILYQGNQITIYYDTNSWNFTRLGKVDGVTQAELKKILGKGDVTAVFEIAE